MKVVRCAAEIVVSEGHEICRRREVSSAVFVAAIGDEAGISVIVDADEIETTADVLSPSCGHGAAAVPGALVRAADRGWVDCVVTCTC